MTEDSDAPSVRESQSASAASRGGFIWYELMTTDPAAAVSFYPAVIKGWKFGDRVPTDVDYSHDPAERWRQRRRSARAQR